VTSCGVPPRFETTFPVARQGGQGMSAGSSALTAARAYPGSGGRVRAMRVFVAGATGAIGRPLVPRLLAAGHEVVGMTRSEEKAAALRAAGADAVICDVYDADGLVRALGEARPEVVVNELTDIPPALNPRRFKSQMAGLNRIRGEGYANLARAAREAGARRLVAESISFIYAPAATAAPPANEDDPVWHDTPEPFATTLRATLEGERTVLESGLEGLVLRYGWFYGPGTQYAADGATTAMIRARRYPVVGDGEGVHSFVHVDDAAEATVAAVEAGATGILNVVDDDPAPLREWLPEVAQRLGAKPPRAAPAFVARLAAGSFAVAFSTRQRGASNARAKEALGWTPARPTWRGALGT
jgi:nucleoside-diphosphate-sugar epimerase